MITQNSERLFDTAFNAIQDKLFSHGDEITLFQDKNSPGNNIFASSKRYHFQRTLPISGIDIYLVRRPKVAADLVAGTDITVLGSYEVGVQNPHTVRLLSSQYEPLDFVGASERAHDVRGRLLELEADAPRVLIDTILPGIILADDPEERQFQMEYLSDFLNQSQVAAFRNQDLEDVYIKQRLALAELVTTAPSWELLPKHSESFSWLALFPY